MWYLIVLWVVHNGTTGTPPLWMSIIDAAYAWSLTLVIFVVLISIGWLGIRLQTRLRDEIQRMNESRKRNHDDS